MPRYGSTEKATHICWGVREGSLEGGLLRLGFDGYIGVVEFSKGGSSFWEWRQCMQRLRAENGDRASRDNRTYRVADV